jgi:hypothetical protein
VSQLNSRKYFLYSSRTTAQLNLITQFISTSITRFTGVYVYVLLVIKHKILYHFMGHCKNKRHINGRHVTYHIQYTLQPSIVIQNELHLYGIKLIKCQVLDGQLLFSTISICYTSLTSNRMKLQFWNDYHSNARD